jgi:2-haloacid dehalogenase
MTRWVTFDCFGTLVDWQTGFRPILRPIVGDRLEEVMAAYHEAEPIVEKEHPSASSKTILRESLARAADLKSDVLAERWGELPVFADTEPTLTALRAAGWKLWVDREDTGQDPSTVSARVTSLAKLVTVL